MKDGGHSENLAAIRRLYNNALFCNKSQEVDVLLFYFIFLLHIVIFSIITNSNSNSNKFIESLQMIAFILHVLLLLLLLLFLEDLFTAFVRTGCNP
jgi:CDP-diglyceride synthetase